MNNWSMQARLLGKSNIFVLSRCKTVVRIESTALITSGDSRYCTVRRDSLCHNNSLHNSSVSQSSKEVKPVGRQVGAISWSVASNIMAPRMAGTRESNADGLHSPSRSWIKMEKGLLRCMCRAVESGAASSIRAPTPPSCFTCRLCKRYFLRPSWCTIVAETEKH